ncbi:MAG: hypothetical protein AAF602_16400 [Myxococcota bacterium]
MFVWLPWAAVALARPPAPQAFCGTYPDTPPCTAGTLSCDLCHTAPPTLGPYGGDLADAFGAPTTSDADFVARLPVALRDVESLDSDGDGRTNAEEIEVGSRPGTPDDDPADDRSYDPGFALRRVSIDVCGRSPTPAEREAVRAAADPEDHVVERLRACLDSDHWLGVDGVLWTLAAPKIRPREPFAQSIARVYERDYNLFVWTQTDDRDARELLTADYQVSRTEDSPPTYQRRPLTGPQAPDPSTRAGMLTTSWFHSSNTMGQALPRVTAAEAYRAYLGYELSVPEGLFAPPGPFVDYDGKGVDHPDCIDCHRTLDPLAYLFARYVGAGENRFFPDAEPPVPPSSHFYPERLEQFVGFDGGPGLLDVPTTGALFGEPGYTLVTWAEAAADSETFARTVVLDYWRHFVGHPPGATEAAEFEAIWRGFVTTDDYRVESMLEALVTTEAYGAP